MAQYEGRSEYYRQFMSDARKQLLGAPRIPYRGQAMSGRKLKACRGGDIAEYLARCGLSYFSFVYEVPRQEDFGVDFFCTLAADGGHCIYPEESFYVQVKSNEDPIKLDEYMIKWMKHHMANPFFICISNPESIHIKMYSTTKIWIALSQCNRVSQITLIFDKEKFPYPDNPHISVPDPDNGEYIILLESPIIDQTLQQLASDRGESAYLAIKPHVSIDLGNIINVRRGSLTTSHLISDSGVNHKWYARDEKQIAAAEKVLENTFIGLALNYISLDKMDKLQLIMLYLIKRGISIGYLIKRYRNIDADKIMEFESEMMELWKQHNILDIFEIEWPGEARLDEISTGDS